MNGQNNFSYTFNMTANNERLYIAKQINNDEYFGFGEGITSVSPTIETSNFIFLFDNEGKVIKKYNMPYIISWHYYNFKIHNDTFYYLGRYKKEPYDLCLFKSTLNADSAFFKIIYPNTKNINEVSLCFDDQYIYAIVTEDSIKNNIIVRYGKLLKMDYNGNVILERSYDEIENIPNFPTNREHINNFINIERLNNNTLMIHSVDNREPPDLTSTIIKTDLYGKVLWRKSFDKGYSVSTIGGPLEMDNGDLVIVWLKDYRDTLWQLKAYEWPPTVYRLDKNGNIIWKHVFETFPNWQWKVINKIFKTKDGNLIGVGYYEKIDEVPDRIAWAFKMDGDGNLIWEKSYYDDNYRGNCWFTNLTLDDDDNLLISGQITGKINNFGYDDDVVCWALQLDSNGCFNKDCDPNDDLEVIKYRNTESIPEFAPLGAEWYYEETLDITGGYFGGYEKDVVTKDTLIEGKLCKVVERTYYSNTDTIIKPRIFFHQDSDKIYTYFNEKFNLYFDYNWKVGDYVRINRWNDQNESASAQVSYISTKKYNEDSLRNYDFLLIGDSCNVTTGHDFSFIMFNEKFGPLDKNLAYNEMEFFNELHYYYVLRCYSDNEFGYINLSNNIACDSIRVGTDDYIFINDLSIYPNPASDHISLIFPEGFEPTKGEIFDIMGRKVKNNIQDFEEINISGLSSGIYIIKAKDEKGRIAVGKFQIIEN